MICIFREKWSTASVKAGENFAMAVETTDESLISDLIFSSSISVIFIVLKPPPSRCAKVD